MNSLSTQYNLTDSQSFSSSSIGHTHHGENILDAEDIKSSAASFLTKAIRITSFNYDYSLASGTTNSFGNDQNPYSTSGTDASRGKLTLNTINFGGIGGANSMPPTKFSYDLEQASRSEQIQVNQTAAPLGIPQISSNGLGSITLSANSQFGPGTILKFLSK